MLLVVFGKEVIRIAIEHHFADTLTGTSSSGISLVGSRRSKSNLIHLLQESTGSPVRIPENRLLNGFPQLAAVEVRVTSGEFLASSQTSEALPASGFQWKRTKLPSLRH